ncbi:MAG: lipopolysaccharide heptosyltransferase family protein [Alphaproteobacteria bacterium]|nr:lipopolysaccharide heptosyltransferase family protein [Alphaproteobacteria bacterium]
MTHLLVVRPGALGDAVLTLPVLRRARADGVRCIAVLGNPVSWSFLRPGAATLHDFGSAGWLGLFTGTLGRAARAAVSDVDKALLLLSGETGPAVAALRESGVADIVVRPPPKLGDAGAPHATERLLGGPPPPVPPLDQDPLLAPSPEDLAGARAILGRVPLPSPLFVLHPGSGGAAKCWPAEHYAALALLVREHYGVPPVILVGPADHDAARALDAAMPANTVLPHVANRPLREVLALLSLATAFVGNDAGPSHLAGLACPTLALFGPTDPQVWRPIGACVAVLRAQGGSMAALSVDAVWRALTRLLGE